MKEEIAWRLFGLGCLAVGALAAWWGIWEPLQQAEAQQSGVRYRISTFVFVPFAAVFGLFVLIFGANVPYRDPDRKRFTPAGWALLLLATAASGALFWWFDGRMGELGYDYSGASPRPKATPTPFQYVPPPPPPVMR